MAPARKPRPPATAPAAPPPGRAAPGPPSVEDPATWVTARALVSAARMLEHEWERHLARYDLTMAGFTVLQLLATGPLPQARLAGACQVEEQTMSRTVERLERQGYVRRELDPADRRRRLVVRTRSGAQVAARSADIAAAESLVLDAVDEPELFRRQVLQLLTALRRRRWGPE